MYIVLSTEGQVGTEVPTPQSKAHPLCSMYVLLEYLPIPIHTCIRICGRRGGEGNSGEERGGERDEGEERGKERRAGGWRGGEEWGGEGRGGERRGDMCGEGEE